MCKPSKRCPVDVHRDQRNCRFPTTKLPSVNVRKKLQSVYTPCKDEGCGLPVGKKYEDSGFCGNHQTEFLESTLTESLFADTILCDIVGVEMVVCDKKATVGGVCKKHSRLRPETRKELVYDHERALNYLADNFDKFFFGESAGRFSEIDATVWFRPGGFGDEYDTGAIFSGELELISDNQTDVESAGPDDYVYYWAENRIIVDNVNLHKYAKYVSYRLERIMRFDDVKFRTKFVTYLESVDADKGSGWDLPTYNEADMGDSLDDIPKLHEELNMGYIKTILEQR